MRHKIIFCWIFNRKLFIKSYILDSKFKSNLHNLISLAIVIESLIFDIIQNLVLTKKAKREKEIKIIDSKETYVFNFIKMNYSVDQYALFMKNCGIFDLLQNHIINNLVDYVLGVEVGMDTNGRKNRTGDAMEDLVESYLIRAGLEKDKTYFKELNKSEVEKKFGLDLSAISNQDKTEKRFDFVFKGSFGEIYACECNFYSGGGSKLNETARSYKTLALESKNISGFTFIWFTDGIGWNSARHNLEETCDVLDTVYNIQDLENGAIEKLLNIEERIKGMLKV